MAARTLSGRRLASSTVKPAGSVTVMPCNLGVLVCAGFELTCVFFAFVAP